MPNWTSAEFNQHIAKTIRSAPTMTAPDIAEKKIHEEILEHCKSKWWWVAHSRMDKPTTLGPGTPDFIILRPEGVLLVEVKKKGGKPSPEQVLWAAGALKAGHKVHFVWSFEEFLEVTSKT